QLLLDPRALLLEGRRLLHPLLLDQDDVPAEVALDRSLGVLAGFEGEGSILERLHHHPALEPAEIATGSARAGILRLPGRDLGEVAAGVEFGDDLLGQILLIAVDQDVPGADL